MKLIVVLALCTMVLGAYAAEAVDPEIA